MPSVGHYANMSRHPPEEKIAILTGIEKRLTRVIEVLKNGYRPMPEINWEIDEICELLGVFDPVNTKWDLVVFLRVNSMEDYDKILGAYFDPLIFEESKVERGPRLSANVFNGSSSKTEIYYTAKEMRDRVFPYLE